MTKYNADLSQLLSFDKVYLRSVLQEKLCFQQNRVCLIRSPKASPSPGGGTLGISGWGCAAGTLDPLAYTRASSAEFCYPILE